jgi:hypothetical protein
MIKIRAGNERGHAEIGWLNSFHTFSFADYYDPLHMNFRHLRVINEDWVKPGQGFPSHFHRDMEIITYVLEGALEHKDSLGNGSVIKPGEIQRMSAGSGITHSEYNASQMESAHLLQIWILPEKKGIPPGYEQRSFDREKLTGNWCLIASGRTEGALVTIHQDADLYAGSPSPGKALNHSFKSGRYGWLQVARGEIRLNDFSLQAGDGASITGESSIQISAGKTQTEILLFDLS